MERDAQVPIHKSQAENTLTKRTQGHVKRDSLLYYKKAPYYLYMIRLSRLELQIVSCIQAATTCVKT